MQAMSHVNQPATMHQWALETVEVKTEGVCVDFFSSHLSFFCKQNLQWDIAEAEIEDSFENSERSAGSFNPWTGRLGKNVVLHA